MKQKLIDSVNTAGTLTEDDVKSFIVGVAHTITAEVARGTDSDAITDQVLPALVGFGADFLVKFTRLCDDIHALRVEMEQRTAVHIDARNFKFPVTNG